MVELPYIDAGEIPPWAKSAFTLLREEGMIDFWGNRYIEPQKLLTRGEAAMIAYALLNKQNLLQEAEVET